MDYDDNLDWIDDILRSALQEFYDTDVDNQELPTLTNDLGV